MEPEGSLVRSVHKTPPLVPISNPVQTTVPITNIWPIVRCCLCGAYNYFCFRMIMFQPKIKWNLRL
jgi:hypothetical protein